MLDTILDAVFNGLLIGTSGYAMFSINPLEHPFAFTSCAVGFCHGCAGICTRLFDSSSKSEDRQGKCIELVKSLIASCTELTSVALVNMDLYRCSQQTNALALGHGFFIVPLAFDLAYKCCDSESGEEESTAVLKDLTILGNIVSLLFLAVNESNLPAGIMALTAYFAYYGSEMLEGVLSGTGENSRLAAYSVFFGLLPHAIRAAGGEAAMRVETN